MTEEVQNIPGKGNNRCEDLAGGRGTWKKLEENCGQERDEGSMCWVRLWRWVAAMSGRTSRLWHLVWILPATASGQ